MTKHAKNKDNAKKLLEFLSDNVAQKMYADQNFEYPVKSGVAWSPMVKSWGSFLPQRCKSGNHCKVPLESNKDYGSR